MTLAETKELQQVIKCFHKLWYSDWTENPSDALALHRHAEYLFNWAGITETLTVNKPGMMTPSEFKTIYGAKE